MFIKNKSQQRRKINKPFIVKELVTVMTNFQISSISYMSTARLYKKKYTKIYVNLRKLIANWFIFKDNYATHNGINESSNKLVFNICKYYEFVLLPKNKFFPDYHDTYICSMITT